MFSISKLIAAAVAALALVACGGGNSPAPAVQVAASNLTVPITAANAAALANIPFVFAKGVPEFGTTGTTTVTITNTATSPNFTIVTPNGTANGVMTFGSCIFRMVTSTFTGVESPLNAGNIITIPNCNALAQVVGKPANGSSFQGQVNLLLGGLTSEPNGSPFNIGTDGVLFLGTERIGKVTLAFVTGS